MAGETDEKRTAKLTIDGAEREVELPDTLLTRDEVTRDFVPKASHNGTVTKLRKELEKRPTVEQLMDDETFLGTLIDTKGDALRERLKVPKGDESAILERAQARFREKELTPVQQELEAERGKVTKLMERAFNGGVMKAGAEAEVTEDVFDLLGPYYRARTKYDPDYDDYFVVDGEGEFEATATPKKGKAPWMTIAEHLEGLRASGQKPTWFKTKTRTGAGFGGPGGKGAGEEKSLKERIEALEAEGKFSEAAPLKTQLAREAAKK